VIFLGLPEPFFLAGMPLSGVAFEAAKTRLMVAQPFGDIFRRPACFFVSQNRSLVLNQKVFSSFSLHVRSHLEKTSLCGFVIKFQSCLWWLRWLDWQV
jgi:hypothetical protein